MSLYPTLIDLIESGKGFYINFKQKTLKVGGKTYIEKGDVLSDEELICNGDLEQYEIYELENPWANIEELYWNFKYSVPSSKYRDDSYFTAIDVNDMNDELLYLGVDRNVAQAMLEIYILFMSLSNKISQNDIKGHFWQSDKDRDLVILKEWI